MTGSFSAPTGREEQSAWPRRTNEQRTTISSRQRPASDPRPDECALRFQLTFHHGFSGHPVHLLASFFLDTVATADCGLFRLFPAVRRSSAHFGWRHCELRLNLLGIAAAIRAGLACCWNRTFNVPTNMPGWSHLHRDFTLVALFALASVCANPDAKRLYDDLLSHYNRLIRPVSNNTEVVTVRLGLHLSQLIDLVSPPPFCPCMLVARQQEAFKSSNDTDEAPLG